MIELFVRNPDGTGGDQIDDFTKFTAILRYCDVGTMSLEVPFGSTAASLAEPGAGIVVEEDGEILFSGVTSQPDRSFSDSTDGYLISFITDEALLQDTLVYPCAPVLQGNGTYKFTASEYDVRTAAAETLMHRYVLANAGPINGTYPWSRPVPGLTFATDLGRGSSITGRARMNSLLELLQAISSISGLGFRVADLEFGVFLPTDRTSEVVFSTEIGNLIDFKYSRTRPEATHSAVAGGGEGVNRVFVLNGDAGAASTWGWRIEAFRDRRDTSDPTELNQTYAEELAAKAEKASFSITPLDLEGYAFGTDYFLGDSITGEADGSTIEGSIKQVTLSVDENGQIVKPDFSSTATAQASYLLKTFDLLRKQQRRISALERNR